MRFHFLSNIKQFPTILSVYVHVYKYKTVTKILDSMLKNNWKESGQTFSLSFS